MTDKLRELAERWNDFVGDNTYDLAVQACRTQLLSILDAEGDGGALAWQFRVVISGKAEGVWHWCNKEAHDAMAALPDNYETRQLYTHPHPVRSGGVSNEQVLEAVTAYSKCANDDSQKANFHECMRTALEHFAKSQGESK